MSCDFKLGQSVWIVCGRLTLNPHEGTASRSLYVEEWRVLSCDGKTLATVDKRGGGDVIEFFDLASFRVFVTKEDAEVFKAKWEADPCPTT